MNKLGKRQVSKRFAKFSRISGQTPHTPAPFRAGCCNQLFTPQSEQGTINIINTMKIVPANDTIADLEMKAAEYEAQASKEQGSIAARLKEKAAQCRQWIAELKSRKWTS